MQLECFPILLADVLHLRQAVQVVKKVEHFLIRFVVVEWDDGDSVAYLVCKAEDGVVNYHNLREVLVEDAQIFDIVALGSMNAVLAVQPLLEQLFLWINVVEDRVGVHLIASCE